MYLTKIANREREIESVIREQERDIYRERNDYELSAALYTSDDDEVSYLYSF